MATKEQTILEINKLIEDENHAITMYYAFLDGAPHSKKTIATIKKIISEEQKHIKLLNQLKRQRLI